VARQKRWRARIQVLATLVSNIHLGGFIKGSIYQGPVKQACVPGLNCYSCPGAVASCPLGSLQNFIGHPIYRVSFFVAGFIVLIGGILGRFVCGWLCPFGLFQEWLNRFSRKKWRPELSSPRLHRALLRGKVVFLLGLVVLWPLVDSMLNRYGSPAFCKYLCPSGTLMAGLPLIAGNEGLRQIAGWLFGWKTLLLALTIGLSVKLMRPFCKYACPLGAMYGFFNRISLYRIRVDQESCSQCGACALVCPMAVPVPYDGNGMECIRCGECQATCPASAIRCGFEYHSERHHSRTRLPIA